MMKRIFDVSVAAVALALFAPLMGLIAVLIYWRMGSPVLFRQVRPGLHGRAFTLYKFRTMCAAFDDRGHSLTDLQRVTALGRWLRRWSLDELPQLWNVLKGDMSLVGPRPLLMEYLPLYTPEQARRHEVKPGITGWAQVNGRNAITWEEKFALDVWYVEHQSFALDMKILWLTVLKVVCREGINASDTETMPVFRGGASQEEIGNDQRELGRL